MRKIIYLENYHGWFVAERSGNRVNYYGPFKTEAEAKKWLKQAEASDSST
jgi:hypothetical protein